MRTDFTVLEADAAWVDGYQTLCIWRWYIIIADVLWCLIFGFLSIALAFAAAHCLLCPIYSVKINTLCGRQALQTVTPEQTGMVWRMTGRRQTTLSNKTPMTLRMDDDKLTAWQSNGAAAAAHTHGIGTALC